MAQPPPMQINQDAIYQVTIETDRGPIVMELDPRLAPTTVNHFVSQARAGFYDGLTFHRVVPDFVIQGGDPEGTGRGGPPPAVAALGRCAPLPSPQPACGGS